MSRSIAIVPAKPFSASKSRLAVVLTDEEREALSARLLTHVLKALTAAPSVDAVWVVGGDRPIAELARKYGCVWLPEPGRDLNDSLARILDRVADTADRVLILPLDLPFLTADAVEDILAVGRPRDAELVIAPDRWEQGTNALLLTHPFALRPAFGPDSLARHLEQGRLGGLTTVVYRSEAFAFDIDTPSDLSEACRGNACGCPLEVAQHDRGCPT